PPGDTMTGLSRPARRPRGHDSDMERGQPATNSQSAGAQIGSFAITKSAPEGTQAMDPAAVGVALESTVDRLHLEREFQPGGAKKDSEKAAGTTSRARSFVERARASALRGDCAGARKLLEQVAREDEALYRRTLAGEAALKKCLDAGER